MIPYNISGKWGWCDTLGKITLKPLYENCTFFNKNGNFWVSSVEKKGVKYKYIYGKGILPLPNCEITAQYSHLLEKNCWMIKTDSGRKGIYDWKRKRFVLDTIAQTILVDTNLPHLIVYCTYELGDFKVLNLQTKKTTISNVIHYIVNSENSKTYFKMPNKRFEYYELHSDGSFYKSDDTINENEYFYTMPETQSFINSSKSTIHLLSDLPIDKGYLACVFIEKDYNSYIIVKKENVFGLMDNKNKVMLLEPIYDTIEFNNDNNFFLLNKDNRLGIKVLNTIYPTILPKYDNINFYKSLQINQKWVFNIFEVQENGSRGFVGENGIEYFKFKK